MSMAVHHVPWISPDDYLDQEELSPTRHMYCGGVVTAMAGGSLKSRAAGDEPWGGIACCAARARVPRGG
jgi:hypothetical protein